MVCDDQDRTTFYRDMGGFLADGGDMGVRWCANALDLIQYFPPNDGFSQKNYRLTTGCAHCAASVKIMYAAQPTPELIKALAEKTIRVVACGHNHTLALDTEGAAYTWGVCLSRSLAACFLKDSASIGRLVP